jgi:hypothetical protein
VPTVYRFALHVLRVFAPERERTAVRGIPAVHRAAGAPESEQRASDLVAARAIRQVVLAVQSRGGPVLFADGAGMLGITQGSDVGIARFGRECLS